MLKKLPKKNLLNQNNENNYNYFKKKNLLFYNSRNIHFILWSKKSLKSN